MIGSVHRKVIALFLPPPDSRLLGTDALSLSLSLTPLDPAAPLLSPLSPADQLIGANVSVVRTTRLSLPI